MHVTEICTLYLHTKTRIRTLRYANANAVHKPIHLHASSMTYDPPLVSVAHRRPCLRVPREKNRSCRGREVAKLPDQTAKEQSDRTELNTVISRLPSNFSEARARLYVSFLAIASSSRMTFHRRTKRVSTNLSVRGTKYPKAKMHGTTRKVRTMEDVDVAKLRLLERNFR